MRSDLVIPLTPSRNILGLSRWWRHSHNDRVVWRQRVQDAVRDVDAQASYVAGVVCDWQSSAMPMVTPRLIERVRREMQDALHAAGIVAVVRDVELRQSGIGRGETRLTLERA